jgi:hypothetical protein
MHNYIAAPQGPAIGRSGTAYVANARSQDGAAALLSFVFSEEQALTLEFSGERIRFLDDNGLQIYDAVDGTVTSGAGATVTFTSATLGANVGDEVFVSGFENEANINGTVAEITAKSGTTYTLSGFVDWPSGAFDAARVYHVPCTYSAEALATLRGVQSVDVLYLLTRSSRPLKLSRYDAYDWRLEPVSFLSGPFMDDTANGTKLKPLSTGNAVPNLLTNISANGVAVGDTNRPSISGTRADPIDFLGRDITYALPNSDYYLAFDGNPDTHWGSATRQKGIIQYTSPEPFACDGYTIYMAKENQDTSYSAEDYAPSSFRFQGYNGTSWVDLDQQDEYVLYEGGKSVFFELDNTVVYDAYRLRITKLVRNGLIEARVGLLTMRKVGGNIVTLNASSTVGINGDAGFKSTDLGRLLRAKGTDKAWRSCEIIDVVTSTSVRVRVLGEPFINTRNLLEWRLGYWSDTTGWPATGLFFEDRLWLFGADEFPDMFAASVSLDYEVFEQTDTFGEVLDDSAIVRRLNSRKLARIQWAVADTKGLLIGTGAEEYVLSSPSGDVFTARNMKARPATRRGSVNAEPAAVDNQVVYIQRGGRSLRELEFVYETDGYKSPSISQLTSHLGAIPFVEMEYAAEPHTLIWVRRQDGSMVAVTYNKDENVVGWHRHDLSGGVVENIAVTPSSGKLNDTLWMQMRRTINGQEKRYIERLMPFWDFGDKVEDAHYVDSGLRYKGEPTSVVYGLGHLEGEELYGLSDALPIGPLTVVDGAVTLAFPGSNIVLGLGFDAEVILPRLEAGAEDGTSQGKTKRVNNTVAMLWDSYGGEIGVYNAQEKAVIYEPVPYPGDNAEFESVELFTGITEPIQPAPGYDQEGILAFRRPKSSPLPFNVVALMPQLNTQDR